jgi:hypothetical protein
LYGFARFDFWIYIQNEHFQRVFNNFFMFLKPIKKDF